MLILHSFVNLVGERELTENITRVALTKHELLCLIKLQKPSELRMHAGNRL